MKTKKIRYKKNDPDNDCLEVIEENDGHEKKIVLLPHKSIYLSYDVNQIAYNAGVSEFGENEWLSGRAAVDRDAYVIPFDFDDDYDLFYGEDNQITINIECEEDRDVKDISINAVVNFRYSKSYITIYVPRRSFLEIKNLVQFHRLKTLSIFAEFESVQGIYSDGDTHRLLTDCALIDNQDEAPKSIESIGISESIAGKIGTLNYSSKENILKSPELVNGKNKGSRYWPFFKDNLEALTYIHFVVLAIFLVLIFS